MSPERMAEDTLLQDLRQVIEAKAKVHPTLAPSVDRMFRREHIRVRGYCRRVMGDVQLGDDIAQDTMATAYRKLPEFRGEAQFGTWVMGIARNLCRAERRKHRDLLTEDGVIDETDPRLSPLQELRREERLGLIRRAAQCLSPLEQEAILLRYEHEMSQQGITELLKLDSRTGARGLLQTCRRRLKVELARLLEELGHGTSLVRLSS